MKIRTRLFVIFLLSTVILVALSIGAVTFFANNSLKNAVIGQIESTAASRSNHVNNFIAERKNEIVTLNENHHIVDYSMEYWRQQHDEIENLWDPLEEGVNLFDHSQAALRALRRGEGDEVFIMNNEGIVILSSEDEAIGKNRSSEEYFTNLKSTENREEVFVEDAHRDEDGSIVMNVAVPFYRPDNKEFFGVLVKKFGINDLNVIVGDTSGLGETGEVYIINKDAYMITNSRFKEDVALNQKIDYGSGAHTCFSLNGEVESEEEHNRDILQTFKNYRGIDVIGTHRSISGTDWCLIVELGSNEAFVSSNRIMIIGVIVLLVALVVSFFVAKFVGGTIGRPVEDLRNDIKVIEGGDLDHKIHVERNDEIGELGDAYNKMVDSLKNSKIDADKKIEESTRSIKEKQEKLVAQNKELMRLKEVAEESVRNAESGKMELQKALNDSRENKEALEKMNELMVGREMKMIELKEKLAELSEGAEGDEFVTSEKDV